MEESAFYQQELPEVPEIGETEVSVLDCLQTFLAVESDSDIGFL